MSQDRHNLGVSGACVRRNRNRGYQELRVWQDAIELYKIVCKIVQPFPNALMRVASQNIASTDSVHRNIADGYFRRSIKEYLQFLYVALASLGETVSGMTACFAAGQISDDDFEEFDAASYKLENGLLKLIERLEQKKVDGTWIDTLIVRESNSEYGAIDENRRSSRQAEG